MNGRLGRVYSDTMICAGGQGRGGCQVKLDDYELVQTVVFFSFFFIAFKRDVTWTDKALWLHLYTEVQLEPVNKAKCLSYLSGTREFKPIFI